MPFGLEQRYHLSLFAPLFHPVQTPYGSVLGSKLFQFLQKLGKNIIDDGADDRPVSILVVMDQPVSQTSNFYPWDGVVLIFKLRSQIGHMLSDVVQGSGDRPLNGLLSKIRSGVILSRWI